MTSDEIGSATSTFGASTWPMWVDRDACLRHELCQFSQTPWQIADAVEGFQVFGGTGSGKTSGSGRAIAVALVRSGFGGLVLTAKPDDLLQWVRYLRAAGLTNDEQIQKRLVVVEPKRLVEVGPTEPHTDSVRPTRVVNGKETYEPLELDTCNGFNFLDYEFKATGLTQDIVSLFLNAMSPGGASVSKADPYWDEALRELLTHAVDLAVWGTQAIEGARSIRLEDLVAIIRTAPQSRQEAASMTWRNPAVSRCWQLLDAANEQLAKKGALSQGRLGDLTQTVEYWMNDFPALSDRTRSVIVSSFTAKATGLLRSPLRELLCGESDSSVDGSPEATHAGKIVLLNLPVKLYGDVGRFAQVILKTIWQRATERRSGRLDRQWGAHRPVFLWADESQYFITKEDALFQQTARSSLAATVYLTQNISNYYAALGGEGARAAVDSLLGNLQTKIFHANGDAATNEWAEKYFGKVIVPLKGTQKPGGGLAFSAGNTQSSQEQVLPAAPSDAFMRLPSGGHRHDCIVEALVGKPSMKWTNNPTRICHRAVFNQRET